MAAKKEFNITELEQQYLEAEKNFKLLREQFELAKKEEEEKKRVKLEAEKETRYKEVIIAYENFDELRNKYIEDYGYITFTTDKTYDKGSHDWFWSHVGMF